MTTPALNPKLAEDMGLGFCLACLVEYKTATGRGATVAIIPKYGITLAPSMVPIPGGTMAVATPTCYGHVPVASPLLAANGSI